MDIQDQIDEAFEQIYIGAKHDIGTFENALKKYVRLKLRKYKNKIECLEAEIAELKTPDSYIIAHAGEDGNIADSITDLMDNMESMEVTEIFPSKRLPTLYAVKTSFIEEEGRPTGEEIETFRTLEKAEAFAASLKGER